MSKALEELYAIDYAVEYLENEPNIDKEAIETLKQMRAKMRILQMVKGGQGIVTTDDKGENDNDRA